MSDGYTRGPWKVFTVQDGPNRGQLLGVGQETGEGVADAYGGLWGSGPEQMANARLIGADLTDADLTRAVLTDADLTRARLTGADLRSFKADLWMTLTEIGGPLEAQHTLAKLRAGKVDGSTYGLKNECACLVGTIAEARGLDPYSLSHGPTRPAERWFAMIKPGDTPGSDTGGGFAAQKAVEWIEEWCAKSGHPTVQAISAATGQAGETGE